jgi:hypothetical protein
LEKERRNIIYSLSQYHVLPDMYIDFSRNFNVVIEKEMVEIQSKIEIQSEIEGSSDEEEQ